MLTKGHANLRTYLLISSEYGHIIQYHVIHTTAYEFTEILMYADWYDPHSTPKL